MSLLSSHLPDWNDAAASRLLQGWVETTFLDDDMRVGRGDKVSGAGAKACSLVRAPPCRVFREGCLTLH